MCVCVCLCVFVIVVSLSTHQFSIDDLFLLVYQQVTRSDIQGHWSGPLCHIFHPSQLIYYINCPMYPSGKAG